MSSEGHKVNVRCSVKLLLHLLKDFVRPGGFVSSPVFPRDDNLLKEGNHFPFIFEFPEMDTVHNTCK